MSGTMLEWLITTGIFVASMIGAFLYFRRAKGYRGEPRSTRLVSTITMGLVIASACQIVVFQIQRDKQTDCQARINAAVLAALKARSRTSSEADSAMVVMAQKVLDAKSAAESRKAVEDFVAAMNEKKEAQKKNPFPELPDSCRPQD